MVVACGDYFFPGTDSFVSGLFSQLLSHCNFSNARVKPCLLLLFWDCFPFVFLRDDNVVYYTIGPVNNRICGLEEGIPKDQAIFEAANPVIDWPNGVVDDIVV